MAGYEFLRFMDVPDEHNPFFEKVDFRKYVFPGKTLFQMRVSDELAGALQQNLRKIISAARSNYGITSNDMDNLHGEQLDGAISLLHLQRYLNTEFDGRVVKTFTFFSDDLQKENIVAYPKKGRFYLACTDFGKWGMVLGSPFVQAGYWLLSSVTRPNNGASGRITEINKAIEASYVGKPARSLPATGYTLEDIEDGQYDALLQRLPFTGYTPGDIRHQIILGQELFKSAVYRGKQLSKSQQEAGARQVAPLEEDKRKVKV